MKNEKTERQSQTRNQVGRVDPAKAMTRRPFRVAGSDWGWAGTWLKVAAFCLLFMATLRMSAQSNEWFATGTTWTYSFQLAFEPGTHQAQFAVTEQTNYAGRDCAKVEYVGDGGNPFMCLAVQPPHYLYESGDSVFYASENDGVFHLAYDFGAAVGDTWEYVVPVMEPGVEGVYVDTFVAEVTAVSTVQIDGQNARRLAVQYSYTGEGDPHTTLANNDAYTITEFIGSETGFFIPFGDYMVVSACDGQFGVVVQCYESESLSYLNPDFESCALSLNNVEARGGLITFPNPTTDKLMLSAAKFEGGTLELFNVAGEKLMTLDVSASPMEIDVSDLAAGTYVLTVRKGTVATSAKFVVQRLM